MWSIFTHVCVCSRPIYSGLRLSPFRRTSRGDTGGRSSHRSFSFFICFNTLPSFCGDSFFFFSREGFRNLFPSSTVKSNFVHPRQSRSPLLDVVREEIVMTLRFEPMTQPSEGYEEPTTQPFRSLLLNFGWGCQCRMMATWCTSACYPAWHLVYDLVDIVSDLTLTQYCLSLDSITQDRHNFVWPPHRGDLFAWNPSTITRKLRA